MYDEEIEKAVLFYIIFDNAQYQISEDDFVNAMNKRIAIAINELRRLKENVSMISVQSRCKENQNEVLAYISKIGDTVIRGLNNPDELYSKLIKLSQKRKLFMLAKKMQAEILEQEEADIYGFGFTDFYCENSQIEKINIKNKNKINILITHGSLDASKTLDMQYNPLNSNKLKEIGFDYVALGHIHKANYEENKNNFIYPGSLISFGFDELGEHGFLDVEINKNNSEKNNLINLNNS